MAPSANLGCALVCIWCEGSALAPADVGALPPGRQRLGLISQKTLPVPPPHHDPTVLHRMRMQEYPPDRVSDHRAGPGLTYLDQPLPHPIGQRVHPYPIGQPIHAGLLGQALQMAHTEPFHQPLRHPAPFEGHSPLVGPIKSQQHRQRYEANHHPRNTDRGITMGEGDGQVGNRGLLAPVKQVLPLNLHHLAYRLWGAGWGMRQGLDWEWNTCTFHI